MRLNDRCNDGLDCPAARHCVFLPVKCNSGSPVVQVLPYWDWTGLYTMSCLVDNPLYEEEDRPERNEDTCQVRRHMVTSGPDGARGSHVGAGDGSWRVSEWAETQTVRTV